VEQWFRVFGTNDVEPKAAALLEQIRRLEFGSEVSGKFSRDDEGWFRAELAIHGADSLLIVERYLTKEEGIRAELNTWAAWLETVDQNPNHGWLMQHLISTTQLFTIHGPIDADSVLPTESLCLELCRFLARETAGVYQVDKHGFYSPDGTLLVEET
jgi:hypothetical protein